jgi:hypothetical protein
MAAHYGGQMTTAMRTKTVAKKKAKGKKVETGGGLRAMLREAEAIENQDAERARARKIIDRQMGGMGQGYTERVKLCVYLDDDYFIVGMDELNLTLWRDRSETQQNPKLLGYYPRLNHLLKAYLEKRVNNASSLKLEELIAVVTKVNDAIDALDGAMIVPVPQGADDE